MKLKIPFLNMKNYVVLKCYNKNRTVVEHAPIVLSNKLSPLKKPDTTTPTFATCYGYVASLKRSATVPMYTDFEVIVSQDGDINYLFADKTHASVDWNHSADTVYSGIKETSAPLKFPDGSDHLVVSKLVNRWFVEEDTGVDFVMASHIRNTTSMRIPTGVANFKHQHSLSIFNVISREPQRYKVKFGTPTIALYPLTDKPFYVESICDPAKVDELDVKSSSHPHFTGTCLKLSK